jgi:hypothetical protein
LTNQEGVDENLNSSISDDEIVKAIRGLKRGKAIGLDYISGEMLKDSSNILLPCLNKLFNRIFRSAIYPHLIILSLSYKSFKSIPLVF